MRSICAGHIYAMRYVMSSIKKKSTENVTTFEPLMKVFMSNTRTYIFLNIIFILRWASPTYLHFSTSVSLIPKRNYVPVAANMASYIVGGMM